MFAYLFNIYLFGHAKGVSCGTQEALKLWLSNS